MFFSFFFLFNPRACGYLLFNRRLSFSSLVFSFPSSESCALSTAFAVRWNATRTWAPKVSCLVCWPQVGKKNGGRTQQCRCIAHLTRFPPRFIYFFLLAGQCTEYRPIVSKVTSDSFDFGGHLLIFTCSYFPIVAILVVMYTTTMAFTRWRRPPRARHQRGGNLAKKKRLVAHRGSSRNNPLVPYYIFPKI